MRCGLFPFSAALVLAGPAWGGEVLTVEQSVERALQQSPRVRVARAQQESAEHSAKSVRGHFLPQVHLSDEQQHWDSPFAIAFALGPPGAPAAQLTARQINTNAFVASAAEPLTGLLYIQQEYSAQSDLADAAAAQERVAEAAVREDVQTQFLRLFEARALGEIARASQGELAEQISVAQSKLKAGVLTTADVLRLQVAAANAKQQEIQAQAEEQVARATLLEALGVAPQEEGIDFAEPVALEEIADLPVKLGDAVGQALEKRPELDGARHAFSAAESHSRSRLYEALLPEVTLEGGYWHFHGQVFQPENSGFVGVKADWSIWEWGAKWYERQAAEAQAAVADAQQDDARRQIGAQVAARVAQAGATHSAVQVARTAIESAQEAYRVTDALVKAGSATTTDLLDAQAALTQAKLNLVRAKYEYGIARVALTRAVGG